MPPTPPSIALDVARCTCSRVRRAARRVTRLYDRALEPAGVTATQFGLLAQLAAESASISIGVLAQRSGMDPTTLNRNLKPLVNDGLVSIEIDAADRRVRGLRLTDAGRQALRVAVPCWRKAQAEVDRGLGPDDVERLHALLARVGR